MSGSDFLATQASDVTTMDDWSWEPTATVEWFPIEEQPDGTMKRTHYSCAFSAAILGSEALAADAAKRCAQGLANRIGATNVLILWN